MQGKNKKKRWFIISALPLLISITGSTSNHALWYGDTFNCSTKAIMHFQKSQKESVNADIYFNFDGKGAGIIVIEGRTDSSSGELNLQRNVTFSYTSTQISADKRDYKINHWVANKSSTDQSPDIIFDYFIHEMSDNHDALLLSLKKMNSSTVLLSSIDSPLYICNLKPSGSIA
ncbi:FidL-like protein [Rouxiella sp. Mn2063]|uniref:FidL-like protein n=1 Tax=Rouxiella sp. Mn2063 TaxID=3395262 RepID=UPI003BD9AAAD